MDVKNDGSRYKGAHDPGGAYRNPSSPETLALHEEEEGMIRNMHHVYMDGTAIFKLHDERCPAAN